MINVNALGDACPIPVVKTKKAIQELKGAGEVCVLVDNEIAVENLTKMAQQKGYAVKSEKLEEKKESLNEEMNDPAIATNVAKLQEISKALSAVEDELAELYELWETLAE